MDGCDAMHTCAVTTKFADEKKDRHFLYKVGVWVGSKAGLN